MLIGWPWILTYWKGDLARGMGWQGFGTDRHQVNAQGDSSIRGQALCSHPVYRQHVGRTGNGHPQLRVVQCSEGQNGVRSLPEKIASK